MSEPFLDLGIVWTLLGGFSVMWIVLGIVWSRKSKGTAGYLFAGRNVGLALVTATLMATWVTGNTVLAAPEAAYTLGLWGMLGYTFAGFGLFLFAPLAVRIKKLMPNGFTSGDFIRMRYGRTAWVIFFAISAVYFGGLFITVGMGAGLLLESLSGIDYRVGMLLVVVVTTIYTLLGGMRAVIGMDFIQAMLIMISLIAVAFLVYNTFGIQQIYEGLEENKPQALNLLLPAGLLYAWNTGLMSMGEVCHSNLWWMRAYASRPTINFRGFMLSGVIWMTVPLTTGAIALAALALPEEFVIEQVNMVFPVVASTLLGKVGAALVLIIVFAALASTLSSLLTTTAAAFTQDIYRQFQNPKANDDQIRKVSRLWVGILAGATILLSWNYVTSLYQILLFTGALVGSTVWPVCAGLYWKRANGKSAFLAMLLGSVSGLSFYFLVSSFAAALIGFIVSALVTVVGTAVSKTEFQWSTLQAAGTIEQEIMK